MNNIRRFKSVLIVISFLLPNIVSAVEFSDKSEKHAGIGGGFGIVKFDTKLKFTNKESDYSIFVDPEGTLDLPETSYVNTFYAAYAFSNKHSIGFAHFRINRETTFIDENLNLGDLINLKGSASVSDKTRFYYLNYGYTLFSDDRSRVSGVLGIYGMDLKYIFEAEGEFTIGEETERGRIKEEISIFAPLPLLGLNFSWAFTPKWSISTKVQLVGGAYQDISAGVLATSMNAKYKISKHWGVLMGLTYFDASVTIEDATDKQEVAYGYNGAFIGLHVGL